uniref:Uncharacterized protein n=1 Tax=Anguilla anguilla TaxID=7936 RepID=A0A0E9Q2W4_ANGAN
MRCFVLTSSAVTLLFCSEECRAVS